MTPNASRAAADFHTPLNLVLAAVFLPLLGPYAALLRRWLPAHVDAVDASRPMYLAPVAHETPVVALGNATREALRPADVLETMLQSLRDALQQDDHRKVAETRRPDHVLDKLDAAI